MAATRHAGTEPTGAAVILRVLRVSLHVGFAVLLLVALVRLLAGGITGQGWITLLLALLLAAFYLVGTVLEKRHAAHRTRFDPRPYSAWWLGGVCLLWLLLVWASADFVWLAFPLFFLQLHVLRRRLALPAIALSTVFVIAALWFHNGGTASRLARPAWGRSCPWCSGPLSAQPSLWSPGWPTGRCSWRRKTSGWRPKSSAAPVPNSPGPSTMPAPWPSAPGWPAKSMTPSPRACPALC